MYYMSMQNNDLVASKPLFIKGLIHEGSEEAKNQRIYMMEVISPSYSEKEISSFIKDDKIKFINDEEEKICLFGKTSGLEEVASISLSYPKGFKRKLYVASSNNNKIVLFVKEREELKEEFKAKILKTLPLPIKGEWYEFLWEEIEYSFRELVTMGKLAYTGYMLNLSVDKLQSLVETIAAKAEWKQVHRRVPNFKPLLSVMDIRGFNFKNWVKFFKPNEEKIKELDELTQNDVVNFWELGLDPEFIMSNLDFLHGVPCRNAQVVLRVTSDKNKKVQLKNYYKAGFMHYFENGEEDAESMNRLLKFSNLFEVLVQEDMLKNIKNKNWSAIDKFLDNYVYADIEEGCEAIAKECARAGVPENHFQDYQDWWLDNIEMVKTAPREYPTISGEVDKTYSWKMSDMADPEAWVAGLDTYCCQHFHNIGGACVEYSILNTKSSGIFMVQKNGRTVAQSFTWLSDIKVDHIGEIHRTLVFDNIEVTGGELKEEIIQAYKDFVNQLEKYADFFKISAVVVGTGYSDVDIEEAFDGEEISKNYPLYASIPVSLGYSDAHRQILIKEFERKGSK